MAKRRKDTTVTAFRPKSIDLTKLNAENSLNIEIRRGDEFLGTLSMGKGSVEWWPKGNKTERLHKRWRLFAKMLEDHMRD